MMHQYYKPDGDLNVGDCMPFFHDGLFRLFYLIDEGHHRALGGLGGHQWVQTVSPDLVNWSEQTMAIPITEEWEGSICTGSVFYHDGTYHAFYATRMRDRTQHLSRAASDDGVHFRKLTPNPYASPMPGYDPKHYRDPFVFQAEDGRFHMLVTALRQDGPLPERGGCLAHLVSDDLNDWQVQEPFLVPGLHNAPECPDYFRWGDWWYLLFSNDGVVRYRMSRGPFGPWQRPPVDELDGPASRVMKTAAFGGDRRIGVAWLGARRDGSDRGGFVFGGNALFRELVQHDDGTLGCRLPPEMTPAGQAWHASDCARQVGQVAFGADGLRLGGGTGLSAALLLDPPRNMRLRARVVPSGEGGSFGLRLGAKEGFDTGYELAFVPTEGRVRMADQTLRGVTGLDRPFELEIVLLDDIADVCIDGRRTLVDRWPERSERGLWFYALDLAVQLDSLVIEDLG